MRCPQARAGANLKLAASATAKPANSIGRPRIPADKLPMISKSEGWKTGRVGCMVSVLVSFRAVQPRSGPRGGIILAASRTVMKAAVRATVALLSGRS